MTATRWTAVEDRWKANLTQTNSNPALWTSNGVGTNGINGVDLAFPVALSSTRTLYLLGDTIWPTAAGQTRLDSIGAGGFLHSCVCLQQGTDMSTATLSWHCGGTTTAPYPFFSPRSSAGWVGNHYPMGGIMLDDVLIVVGMLNTGDPQGLIGFSPWTPWAMRITGDFAAGTPESWTQTHMNVTLPVARAGPNGHAGSYTFSNGIVDAAPYVYLWANGPWTASGEWALARCDRTALKAGTFSPVWWNGTAFVADSPTPTGISRARTNVAPAEMQADQPGHIHLRSDGKYQMTAIPTHFRNLAGPSPKYPADPRVKYALRTTPTGAFGALADVYDIPTNANTQFFYSSYVVPNQTFSGMAAGDQVMIYSQNGEGALSSSDTYWVQFLKVPHADVGA